ncbi:hypothetical protein DL546_001291 [Coniochaeta pulveracea]|uniref:AB hydrolase-1 domain-containing protein n=1 Tax=Coniochaeta pulveracea TaxID=177199 RepID=A0A420YLL5_9PEZI|nr:hypothetical protein DL546_001291 [Coniochaeta pulveracea]
MEPPIPRTPRDRAGERAREHDRTFRRTNPPPTISATEANRDYTFELQYGRSRERHTSPANRYPDNRPDRAPPPIPPASPEVISSLISSLAVISRPVSQHFDGPLDFGSGSPGANHLSVPVSPTTGRSGGSFGVDYGAFSQPSLDSLQEEDVPLDELPACPPVVKTSKRPSGYSSLTAPKSPLSPNRPSLKSLLAGQRSSSAGHGSRPSSRGSLTSATGSIGNLSLERGVASPLDMPQSLKKQRSHDSWSRAFSRGSKGLMYMSSKEQLRERELEKKRASVGAVGGSPNGHLSPRSAERQDPFLAETPITEEPHGESPPRASAQQRDHPRAIPVRESSLRKTGSTPKKSAARASRSSKRDSDTGPGPTIHEIDEPTNTVREQQGSPRKRGNLKTTQETDHEREPSVSLELPRQRPAEQVSNRSQGGDYFQGSTTGGAASPMSLTHKAEPLEEGAPSPAVAQGRRRDREVSRDRRRSGRQTPELLAGYISGDNGLGVKLKRSSTRLKRLSGVSSPTTDKPPAEQDKRNNGNTHSDQPTIAYERPRSADSIDDAVESYLCSPRLSQKIRHPQTGRVISFSEVGDPNGSAVFCCVGMGLTRYITAFYDELALTLKLRLITPDRPGVGDSEPYAEGTATPLGWPDDVYAICQSLKITKFSILAHSAGAIYALATALRMPQHIRGRIHLLAPWIPPSQMSVFGATATTPLPPTNAIPTSQRILRALPTPFLKAANSSFMTTTSSSITSSLPKQKRAKREKRKEDAKTKEAAAAKATAIEEKENLNNIRDGPVKDVSQMPTSDISIADMDRIRTATTSPQTGSAPGHRHQRSNSSATAARRQAEKDDTILFQATNLASSQLADRERQQIYDTRLTHAIWQLATTGANPAVDLLVCLERRHTIGFRYVDITRPVVIHHGSKDTRVPVENVRWLGKTMRRCEVRVLEGEGHGLMASAAVMGGVLMEVSREWEDWSRITGQTKRREDGRGKGSSAGQAW